MYEQNGNVVVDRQEVGVDEKQSTSVTVTAAVEGQTQTQSQTTMEVRNIKRMHYRGWTDTDVLLAHHLTEV